MTIFWISEVVDFLKLAIWANVAVNGIHHHSHAVAAYAAMALGCAGRHAVSHLRRREAEDHQATTRVTLSRNSAQDEDC